MTQNMTQNLNTKKSLTALIVLNVALILGIAIVTLSPNPQPALAQLGGGSTYTMLAGEATGVTQEQVVYIVDTRSYRVAAITFNSGTTQFRDIAGRELLADFNPNNRRINNK